MHGFDYHRAASLEEAARLAAKDGEAKLLAGGMTLIPTLKQRLAAPSKLIDMNGLAALAGIAVTGEGAEIGAMTRHGDVAGDKGLGRAIPALARLAAGIGDPQVRNRGTLGGSLANNDPAADYPAAVLALGAKVRTNQRTIAADDFFTGMFETALKGGEIITAVVFPTPRRAAYAKFANPASRYAIVGVFVAETAKGVRVAVTGAAPCVFRWTEAETALARDFRPEAVAGLAFPPDTLNSDLHASADYRAHLMGVMTRRAVAAAGG